MNPIEVLLSEPFAQTLGWTLLHFVWQGGLVALLLAIALRVLRRHAAPVRYAVACGALLLLLMLPMITLGLLWPTSAETPVVTAGPIPALPSQLEAVPEAGAVVPLHHQHLASKTRQRGGGNQTADPAADDHDLIGVVPGLAVEAHGATLASSLAGGAEMQAGSAAR